MCVPFVDTNKTVPSRISALLVWLLVISAVLALGFLRVETSAEYAFSSAVLIPIVVITWLSGRARGLILTAIAMAVWIVADVASNRQFGAAWIAYNYAANSKLLSPVKSKWAARRPMILPSLRIAALRL